MITNGILTKDELPFIVDSFESTSAATSCPVITTVQPLSYDELKTPSPPPPLLSTDKFMFLTA
jgi:hypothetical protein